MSTAGYTNLYHGGGGIPPVPTKREHMYDPAKNFHARMSGFGSKPSFNFIPQFDPGQYPQPDIAKNDATYTQIECIKSGATIALGREVHIKDPEQHGAFSPRFAEDNHNAELWRWFLRNRQHIEVGHVLNLAPVPIGLESTYIYLRAPVALPGMVFDVVEFHTDTVIEAGVDWGEPVQAMHDQCLPFVMRIKVPEELEFSSECVRTFGVKLVEIPPLNEDDCKPGCGGLDGFCIDFSVKAFCPWSGE